MQLTDLLGLTRLKHLPMPLATSAVPMIAGTLMLSTACKAYGAIKRTPMLPRMSAGYVVNKKAFCRLISP